MAKNRRKNDRLKQRWVARFGVEDLEHSGVCSDISVGGLFISTNHLLAIGSRVHLHVTTKQGHFYAEGEVMRRKQVPLQLVRLDPPGMGIRFVSPSELVTSLVPHADRIIETAGLRLSSREITVGFIDKHLKRGKALVPVGANPPPAGSEVEFEITLTYTQPEYKVLARGRAVRIIEDVKAGKKRRKAIIEVHSVEDLCAALEGQLLLA